MLKLLHCGYYPGLITMPVYVIARSISCLLQGGGRLTLSAAALAEGKCLPAVNLTDQGQVTRIRIMTHTAGDAQSIWLCNCQVHY